MKTYCQEIEFKILPMSTLRTSASTGRRGLAGVLALLTLVVNLESHAQAQAPPTFYVNAANRTPVPPYTSWATAATNIQDAILADHTPGRLVLVADGVYEPELRGVSNLVLRSVNGPTATVIDGQDRGPCVIIGPGGVVSGFTLRNGRSDEAYSQGSGGGAWCHDPRFGVLTNCVITGNRSRLGAGVRGGTLYDCTLTDNVAEEHGGGACEATLYNCTLRGNAAQLSGGGAARSTLHQCTLIENTAAEGGGVAGDTNTVLYNCILRGNRAKQRGGGAYAATLSNCALTDNQASLGGGGAFGGTLYNCTVTANAGGGLHSATACNCLVYFNDGGNWGESTFAYSCTLPLPPGPGNLDLDPQLVSTTHLSDRSPCLAAGNPLWATRLDIDGEPWADPPAIGADQVWPGQATGPLTLEITAEFLQVAPGFPIRFAAHNTGRILSSTWDFGDGVLLTNQPVASHAWTAPGTYTVRLTGYNDTHPEGVTTSLDIAIVAAVRYVDAANPTPVPPYVTWATAATNIQDALNANPVPGRLVWVTNGVYQAGTTERDGPNRVALTNVVVRSVQGPEATIISGNGTARCAYVGEGSTLSGFTLTGGVATHGGGVLAAPSGVVTNCLLAGNAATTDGGGAWGGTLHNCRLSDNKAARGGGGAFGATLHNCTLTANTATFGGGAAGSSVLYHCTVTGNTGGGAHGGRAFNSLVYFNQGGNWVDTAFEYSCTTPAPPGRGNLALDPRMASATHLSAVSPCLGAGNPAWAQGVDIDGEPWADPPAIGADQLWPGQSFGPLTMQMVSQGRAVGLDAGTPVSFAALNTGPLLSSVWSMGDGTWITNQPYVVHAWKTNGTYTVRLTGFNDLYPYGITTELPIQVYAPVRYVNAANPTPAFPHATWATAANHIQDAILAGTAPGRMVLVTNGVYQGAPHPANGLNRMVLTDQIQVQSLSGPRLTRVEGADGVRCAYIGEGCTLSGFTLTGGYAEEGGGAYCEPTGVLTNCILTANTAAWGGGGVRGGILYNCLLTGNVAGWEGGGAAYCTLYHCSLTGNQAGWGCGASGCTLINSIVYGNTAPDWGDPGNWAECEFEYSCTSPLPEGPGNVEADPRFVNLSAGDLRLRPASPCIDAGKDLAGILSSDIFGVPRPQDGDGDGVARVDMGAHEFDPRQPGFEAIHPLGSQGLELLLWGQPGTRVRLERSRDLKHWDGLDTHRIPVGGLRILDPSAAGEPQGFYRTVVVP